ncbi:MAG: IS1182 family transposase [Actinobacteria bacterium]|nr:IS1182 family transposase [Actinomycetota bacterium]
MKGTGFVGDRIGERSIFAVLHREGHRLFPDEMFADLFESTGRRSVPPQIVAVVMVLQRWHGLSDRDAVEAFEFDARWKYACGGLDFDHPGFAHTVLVSMRARLARSDRPRRIFDVTLEAARAAGVVSAKRVLDSTPVYDAVATQDTVTMIRSAIRRLLAAADRDLEAGLRAVVCRDDDYLSGGKPTCDWHDPAARERLVADLAADAHACLGVLEGRDLDGELARIGELLATVVGQDLEQDDEGRFRIARRVARDRVISTVDPDARHGHKTAARSFDGYKGHIAADPDSEIITDTTVTAGNAGDASVAADLIADLLTDDDVDGDGVAGDGADTPTVYGDAAYGTGEFQQRLDDNDIESGCRTQPASAPGGRFSKDRFDIDLDADTVTCPNQVTVGIRRATDGSGTATFGQACAGCPLRAQCTTAAAGRSIKLGVHEPALARARHRQQATGWQDDYRATRPKVERKLGHMMRRRHGGRRARVRGQPKVDADFNLLAAATNMARLAVLRLRATPTGWAAG